MVDGLKRLYTLRESLDLCAGALGLLKMAAYLVGLIGRGIGSFFSQGGTCGLAAQRGGIVGKLTDSFIIESNKVQFAAQISLSWELET